MSPSKDTLYLITHSSAWLCQGTCAKTRRHMGSQDRGCPSPHSDLVPAGAVLRGQETQRPRGRERQRGSQRQHIATALIPSQGSADTVNHQTHSEWFVTRAPVELTQKALLQHEAKIKRLCVCVCVCVCVCEILLPVVSSPILLQRSKPRVLIPSSTPSDCPEQSGQMTPGLLVSPRIQSREESKATPQGTTGHRGSKAVGFYFCVLAGPGALGLIPELRLQGQFH